MRFVLSRSRQKLTGYDLGNVKGANLGNIITIFWMEVKVLPLKVTSDSLPDHTETNHQSEAGIRTQSDI